MSALIKTGFNFLDLVDLNSKIEKMKDEPWRDATKSLLCKLCDHMTNRKKHARQMQELVLFEVFEYLESLAEHEKREISNYFLDIDNILQVPDIKKIPGKDAVGEDEYDSDEELKKMIEKKTTAMGEVNKAQGEVEGIIKDAGFGKELEEAKDSAKDAVNDAKDAATNAVDDAKTSLENGVENTIPNTKNNINGGNKKKIRGGEEQREGEATAGEEGEAEGATAGEEGEAEAEGATEGEEGEATAGEEGEATAGEEGEEGENTESENVKSPMNGSEMKLRITNANDFGIGPVPDFGNLGADQDMYVVRHQAQAILDFYTAKIKVMYSDEQVHPEISNLIIAFKKCIKDFIDGHRKENLRFMLQPITQYTSYSHKLLLETVIEDHINNILEMYFTSIKSLNKENESDKKTLVNMSNIFVTKYASMLEHLIAVVRDPGNYTMKKKIKSIYEKSREKIQCPATFNFEHLIKMPTRNPPYDEEVLERWKKQFEKLESKAAAKQEINAYNEEKKKATVDIIKQSLESSYESDVLDNTTMDLDKTEKEEKQDDDKEEEQEQNDEKEEEEEEEEQGETKKEGEEKSEGKNDEKKPMSRVERLYAEAEAEDTKQQKGGKKYKTSKTYKQKNNKKNKTIKIKCL
jgi:hypothetical protein